MSTSDKKEVSEALRLVLVSLDSMLIPGIEAEKMRSTRVVIEECIHTLENGEEEDGANSDQTDGRSFQRDQD